jgi:probable rRNA maturation factor
MSDGPTGPEIGVVVDCDTWLAALPDVENTCRRVAAAALGAAAAGWPDAEVERMELAVVLADDARVRMLNRDYRGQDKPTNVLSFAALDDDDAPIPPDGPIALGDVILAYETTVAEAAQEGKTLVQHLSHLVVHGVLHLLGHDHQDEGEAEEMEGLEVAVLAALGIPDPYAQQQGDDAHR